MKYILDYFDSIIILPSRWINYRYPWSMLCSVLHPLRFTASLHCPGIIVTRLVPASTFLTLWSHLAFPGTAWRFFVVQMTKLPVRHTTYFIRRRRWRHLYLFTNNVLRLLQLEAKTQACYWLHAPRYNWNTNTGRYLYSGKRNIVSD